MKRLQLPRLRLLQTLLAIFASTASIIGVCVTLVITVDPFGDDNPAVQSDPVAGPPSTPEPTPTRGPFTPTGDLPDLVAVEVSGCSWNPSSGSLPELDLRFIIAGEPDFVRQVPVEIVFSGRRLDDSFDIDLDEWFFAEDSMRYETYVRVSIQLLAEDLGRQHDVVIHIAPDPDFIPERDKSNNEASVRLSIPEGPLPADYEELSGCTSPIP